MITITREPLILLSCDFELLIEFEKLLLYYIILAPSSESCDERRLLIHKFDTNQVAEKIQYITELP